MSETTTDPPKRGPGRPRRPGGPDPVRPSGRHGKIWDDCETQAKADGQTMTDFVREAITRELARRRELTAPRTLPAIETTQCGTAGPGGLSCERSPGHRGDLLDRKHGAYVDESGELVRW